MSIQHHLKPAAHRATARVRSSAVNVINGTAYMTVIPPLPIDPAMEAAEQARAVLAIVEERLAMVGSDKTRVAHVTIWLAHLLDFDAVTEVWNDWIDPAHPPVRACAQVGMANPALKVEMIVVADAA